MTNAHQTAEKSEPLRTIGGNVNGEKLKNTMRFPQKIKNRTTI